MNKKNIIIKVLIISIIIAIAIIIFIFLKQKDNTNCVPNYRLLDATGNNFEINDINSDYLEMTRYTLTRDGVLRYREIYNKSREKNIIKIKISNEDKKEIIRLINKVDRSITSNACGCDGTSWIFKLFDNQGENNFTFDGYIYGSEFEKIINILNKYIKS